MRGRTGTQGAHGIAGRLMQRADSLEKTLMLEKIEGRRRGQQRMSWFDRVTDSMDMNLRKLQEMVKDRGAWRAAVHEVTKSQTRLSNGTAHLPMSHDLFLRFPPTETSAAQRQGSWEPGKPSASCGMGLSPHPGLELS